MNRFIKLDSDGGHLPNDATQWAGVLDTSTNLIWSADTIGSRMTQAKAEAAAQGMMLCGAPARLPTVDELFALADRSRYRPAIDTAFFPDTKNDWYWSSSPCAGDEDYAWVLYFNDGSTDWDHRDGRACVRAVRSAAPAAGQ